MSNFDPDLHTQAVAGAGFDWKFSEEAVNGGILMRIMSMVVSVGGMLITALLLGIVSGVQKLHDCLLGIEQSVDSLPADNPLAFIIIAEIVVSVS